MGQTNAVVLQVCTLERNTPFVAYAVHIAWHVICTGHVMQVSRHVTQAPLERGDGSVWPFDTA